MAFKPLVAALLPSKVSRKCGPTRVRRDRHSISIEARTEGGLASRPTQPRGRLRRGSSYAPAVRSFRFQRRIHTSAHTPVIPSVGRCSRAVNSISRLLFNPSDRSPARGLHLAADPVGRRGGRARGGGSKSRPFGRSYSPQTFRRRAEVTDALYCVAVRAHSVQIPRPGFLEMCVGSRILVTARARRHSDEPPCLAIRGLDKVETGGGGGCYPTSGIGMDPRSRIINRLVLRPRDRPQIYGPLEYN